MARYTLTKKSQVWSVDAIVGGVIFLIGVTVVYFYAVNYSTVATNELDKLFHEGTFATKILLSEDETGLLSGGKINQTKLETFYYLDYDEQRKNLGVVNDYFFTLPNMEINSTGTEYVGKLNDTDTENLVKINRVTVYKNKPVKLEFYSWS